MRRSIPATSSFRSSRLSQRASVDEVIARLRPKLAQVPGGRLYLAAVQDLRAGGRQSNAQYQYTLQSENVQDLYTWTPKLVDALEHNRGADRRQLRPAAERAGDRSRHRPRHRLAARHHAAADRQHALRRLRPASGLGHLQRHQPVSRRHGDRPALHAVPDLAARRLCRDVRRNRAGHGDDQCAGRHRHGRDDESAPSSPRSTPPASAAATAPSRRPSCRRSSASANAHATINAASARNAFTNALANTGHGSTSAGAAVSTNKETMIPLAAVSHYQPGQHAAVGQSPGIVRRLDHLVQPAAGQIARRGGRGDQRRHRPHQHADRDHRHARRHGAAVPAVARPKSRS